MSHQGVGSACDSPETVMALTCCSIGLESRLFIAGSRCEGAAEEAQGAIHVAAQLAHEWQTRCGH